MVEMLTRESALAYFITIKQLNKGPPAAIQTCFVLTKLLELLFFMQIGSDPSFKHSNKKITG